MMTTLSIGMASAKAITDYDYNRLRNVFSDAHISTMSEEEKEKYLTFDLEKTQKVENYYKGTSNYNNDSYTWTQISKEEYDKPSAVPASVTYSENYKKITLSSTPAGEYYYFSASAEWKYMPTVRSYDVIAMRYNNVALIKDTISGVQFFKQIGKDYYETAEYAYDGANTNLQKLGFGISMNLVNNDINSLELNISALGMVSGSNPQVWADYQHAIRDVTQAQSKSYTISAAGYGNVINFIPSIENYYDGMYGVTEKLS